MTIKALIALGLGAALGLVGGYYFVQFEFANTPEGFFDGQWPPHSKSNAETAEANLQVDGGPKFDFGKIQTGKRYEHEFIVRNLGANALEFELMGPLPAALAADVPVGKSVRLPSEATYPIALSVQPTEIDPAFAKAAVLRVGTANYRLVLSVTGDVEGGLLVAPPSLTIPRDSASGDGKAELELFCWTSEQLGIASLEVEGHANEPWIRYEAVPFSAEQLSRQPGAKSGATLKITIMPEWPAGVSSAALLIRTDLSDYQPLRVPVRVEK